MPPRAPSDTNPGFICFWNVSPSFALQGLPPILILAHLETW